ncbi:hypothetical protein CBL_07305 [Carabus blaptoides fortunei]
MREAPAIIRTNEYANQRYTITTRPSKPITVPYSGGISGPMHAGMHHCLSVTVPTERKRNDETRDEPFVAVGAGIADTATNFIKDPKIIQSSPEPWPVETQI